MDPTATLVQILDGLDNDGGEKRPEVRIETAEALRNLAHWVESGGFLPDVPGAIEKAGWPLEESDEEL